MVLNKYAALPLSTLLTLPVAAQEKPNFVIIMADDMGWGDISYHGSTINTPNIDSLFRNSIELQRHYSAPVSSPARAGLMTGRYPSRFGIRETVIPPWRDYGLDETEATMADVLRRCGYKNRAIIGKWHLGHGRMAYYPLNRGFTHFYGHLNGAIEYFTHLREGELDWHNDWDSCYDQGYSTDLITDEAIRCIKEYSRDSPYLLYVAYNAPHSPYEAPEDEIAKLIDLDEFKKLSGMEKKGWTYRAMMTRLDKGIGRIIMALEESGELDNTVILFMSDNGGVPSFEPYSTNRPLKGSKFTEYEGGVRVAAAIRWPAGFKIGMKQLDEVTSFVDILPTFAEMAGVQEMPERPYDGESILSLLNGKRKHKNRMIYLGAGAMVSKKYKMILAGRNPRLNFGEDFVVDLSEDPYEEKQSRHISNRVRKTIRRFITKYDTLTPVFNEIPYSVGKEGFKAPKEWKVTKP